VSIWFAKIEMSVDKRLFYQIIVSTILMTVGIIPCTWMLPPVMTMTFGAATYVTNPW